MSLKRYNRAFITLTLMLVTILEVLDMTIVNVALPSMMGSLGANAQEITWVLTSYIVAAAILMPLTGRLIERWGQRKLLLSNIIGFCISSMLCGLSTTLPQMIVFRTLQGLFGASLVPLSQFILRNTYAQHEQGKAMALWGVGVMVAPVLGPTLGGFITESLNWRWIFFINLPVCLIAFILSLLFIKKTPIIKGHIDWLGLSLLILSIGSLQLFLDQGNSYDWFNSTFICSLCLTFVLSTFIFIYRGLTVTYNIIDLHLFKNKNFLVSSLLILGYMVSLFGVIALQPMLLENLMNYPIAYTGIIMAPRGLASAVTMAFVAGIIQRIDPKTLILIGLIISFISGQWLSTFQLNTSDFTLVMNGIFQGIGMGLFFVPVSMLAMSTLKLEQTGEASGLFSLSRSIGSSIGISVMSLIATRETQINYQFIRDKVTLYNHNLVNFLSMHHLEITQKSTLKLLSINLFKQANFNAFIDCFLLSSYGFLILIPLVYFLEI